MATTNARACRWGRCNGTVIGNRCNRCGTVHDDPAAIDETFSGSCPTCGQADARRAPRWFLVHAGTNNGLLVLAVSGADIEDVVRRHGLDCGPVSWEPLDDLADGDHGLITIARAR